MIQIEKIIQQAIQLNLSGFKESLQLQSEDVKYSSLSFEQRLFALFEAEINLRQDKKINRFLNAAKLKDKLASLDQIKYLPKRKIDKSVISSLASCDFITNSQNILITGATGTGKSYLAQALARRAISLGYPAKYYRIATLLECTFHDIHPPVSQKPSTLISPKTSVRNYTIF